MMRYGTIICVAVLLIASATTAQSSSGAALSLEGRINVVWTDPLPGEGGTPGVLYSLVDDEGVRWRLSFGEKTPASLSAPSELKGARFTVDGVVADDAPTTLVVADAEPLATREPPLPVLGSQPYVWVLLKFSDDPDEPEDQSFFEYQGTGGPYPTLTHYWSAVSYGNVDLAGSDVTVWIDLPNPRSHYVYEFDPDHEGDDFDATRAFYEGVMSAEPYVDFTQFKGINLCFNDFLAGEALGGWQTATLDGEYRDWPVTWLGQGGWMTIGIVAHEMGHSFTMPHSSGPYLEIYDSYWDVMSEKCGECTISDPTYLHVPIGPIAWQRDKVGWIHGAHLYSMPTEPTVSAIFLNDLNYVPPLGRMLMGRIYTSYPLVYYTVERRCHTAYDGAIPDETVVIHHVDLGRGNPAWVQDETYDFDPNDEGARWDLGESFDNTYGTVIHVQEADATGSLVVMTNSAQAASFVDPDNAGTETGSIADPWNTLFEGYGGVTPDGTVYVESGTYYGSYTFNKPLTMTRWGISGEVTIVGGS